MDSVSISIPAEPRYLQIVRLISAGLSSRLGFTLDEIEDLKIAVDELSAYLTGAQGREGFLDIRFDIHDDALHIHGSGRFAPGTRVRTELTEFSRMILSTVADEASLQGDGATPEFSIVKSRSASTLPTDASS